MYWTYSAKPSLRKRSFHQSMVTRLPNHMWASSWATVTVAQNTSKSLASSLFTRRLDSL